MARRKVLRGVLHSFLGTYTSRYADYRGYWLFGQLPPLDCAFDLLGQTPSGTSLAEAACRLAIRRFAEQVRMSGLTLDRVREATLHLFTSPEVVTGQQGDHEADGHMVQFTIRAVLDNGHAYQDERTVFVAPHNADQEKRRAPADWGT